MAVQDPLDVIQLPAGSRLSVVEIIPGPGKSKARVRCECGVEKVIRLAKAKDGSTKSCGCLHRERAAGITRSHGRRSAPEYGPWYSMISRCTDESNEKYASYGGRGITVWPAWTGPDGLAAFVRDMGPRPSPDHSIDRIKNDRGYSPDNCRWATRIEQARNTRSNRPITAFGRTLLLCEWSELTGINKATIRGRLARGWSPEDAVGGCDACG